MRNILITIVVGLSFGWLVNVLFPSVYWGVYAAIGLAAGITSTRLERKAGSKNARAPGE